MNLQDFREQYSWLDGLSDESALNVLHETFYPKEDKAALAKGLGVSLKSEEKDTGGFWKDAGITALKSAISVPEAAVGLADMVTMGGAGRLAEEAGFRPKEAKAMLDEGYSDRQKAAFKAVQDAEGFTGKMAAALENPSVIAHSVGESIAPMLAGGVVARGLMGMGAAGVSAGAGGVGPVVPGMMARTFGQSAPMVAGAVGEGVLGAGSAAEQIRQQTPDGYLTGEQAALAGATGVATTAFGLLGGKIAQRMGIGDVDTMLVGAARDPGMRKGVVRSFLEGAASEGILEELPQSVSEQVLQNAALGKPLDEGVDQAAVLGLLSGGAMGGGAGAFGSLGSATKEHPADIAAKAQADALRATKPQGDGPLSTAVGAGIEAEAQKVEAAGARMLSIQSALSQDEVPTQEVAQTTPPDGLAILNARREAEIQAGRAAESPDDEILQSIGFGANTPPAQSEAQIDNTMTRMAQADAATVDRAPRARSDAIDLTLPTADPVRDYVDNLRQVNTPAAKFYVGEFDVGRITPADVQQRMTAERGKTPDERLADAAAQAPKNTPQPGDLLNPKGEPFKTLLSARLAAKKTPGDVIEVVGGYSVRPRTEVTNAQATPVPASQPQAYTGAAPSVEPMPTPAQAEPVAVVAAGQPEQAQPLKPAAQATTALGRNGVPVAEGGKPFKTKAEADTARKLQPMMRVKRDGNGFVLVEKTAAQIAAQEKAARRNLGSVGASGGPLSAHAFLASQGGLSKSTMADLGFDRNVRVGSKWLFTNTGMTLEGMTEALQQNGYVQGTEQNPAIEMVRRSANGQPQYTADGWNQIAQAEATARFEDHLAAQQDAMTEDEDFDPFSPDAIAGEFEGDDLAVAGYDAKQDPIKLEVNALLAQAEALGIDTDTIRETAYEDTKNESEQAYYERVRDELTRAINASAGSGGNQKADGNDQGGQGPDAQRGGRVDSRESNGVEGAQGADGPAEGLTAPTRSDIEAQQVRAEQTKRQKDAADRADQDKVKKDDERKRIAQASVAAADTFELGQDPLQNLTGQQDIFGAAAVPAKPTTIDKPATKDITTADVARATGEAKEAITLAIDAMPAQQAQKIAAGFFPSMGLPRVLGKKHIKATITDKPLNLLAAASEFGAELSPETKAALEAEFEGRVVGGEVAAKPAAKTEAQKPATVENFGEKLPPARRAMAAKLNEDLSDDRISSMPLSQIWPATENDAIEDTFAAAVAHVMREAIPAKPRTTYKVKSWVGKVRLLRGFAADIMGGKFTKEKFITETAKVYALKDMLSKIKLLEQIDRADWARIGDVSEAPNAVRYEDNKQIPTPSVSVTVDGRSHWLRGSGDVSDHLDGIKSMLGTAAPDSKMQFEIRQDSGGARKVFINKKGDKEYRRLMTFDTVAEARAAVQNQYTELVAAWEGVKSRDNITERDVRSDVNRDRAGKDHRQGKDVSAEDFESKFGFRGGEFGKWVKQGDGAKERQFLLNNAYDALMDLSDLLGIPPKAISLEGTLGIAFGSRGSGAAAAHFEPSNLVINLTKTRGAGSLAHEWFHALDNYFARKRGGEVPMDASGQVGYRNNNYITHKTTPMMVRKDGRGSPLTKERLQQWRNQSPNSSYLAEDQWQEDPKHKAGVRVEVEQAFNDLVAALNASPMLKRARVLDGVKENGDGYWSRTLEMAARSFENFVQTRMMEQGYHNDFLANVKAAPDVGKNTERYPYLMPNEIAPIAQAFDSLFGTIQSKETENGNVALFSQNLLSQKPGPKPTLDQIERFVQRVQDVAKNVIPITVVGNPAQINVLDVPAGSNPTGALIDGRIYLFADNIKSVGDAYSTLFHEIFHLGLQKVIPAEAYSALLKNFASSPLVARYARQWKQSPEGVEKAGAMPTQAYEALASEEALAMVSEALAADQGIGSVKLPGLVKRMLSWFAKVSDQLGFPANFGNWMRGLTQTAAERFVSDMTRAVLGGEKNLAKTQAKYGTQYAQLTSQNRFSGGRGTTTVMPETQAPGPQGDAQQGAVQGNAVARSNMPEERDGFTRMHHAGSDPINGGYWQTVPSGGVFDGFFALTSRWGGYGTGAKYFSDIPSDKVLSSYELEYKLDYETVKLALESVYNFDEDDFDTVWKAVIEDKSHKVDDDDMLRLFSPFSIGEASWEAQRVRGLVADKLGYQAVEMDDENGISYLIVAGTPITRVLDGNEQSTPTSQGGRFRQSSEALNGAEPFGVTGATADQWDGPLPSKWDDYVFKLQDKLVDLKRVTQSITRLSGKLADDINVYLQEELYHGRTAKRVQDFTRMELEPALKQLAAQGFQLADLEEYMHARHAKEANRVIAERNPDVEALQDGGSGMKDAEADAYFAKLPKADAYKLAAVAAKFDAIMAETNRLMVEYELEPQSAIDSWGTMFKHYVPLHREDKAGGRGTGQGFSIKGRETKGRTGSTRKVVDIISHIAQAREKTVVRGEKNRVAQALVGLVTAHPNQDFWRVGPPESERVFNPKTGVVEERVNPLFKSLPNVVMAKVAKDGVVREVAVTFNEDDERAVRMAGALKNLDTPQIEGWLGTVSKMTRYFSSINTQYNPVFGVVNLVRDIQGAIINMGATELADQKAQVAKDAVRALAGIYKDIRATRKGGVASSEWSRLYEQFQNDGGQTGFRDLFATPADRTEALNSVIDPEAWAKSGIGKFFSADGKLTQPLTKARGGFGVVFNWLSDYNEAMENGVRLAAYKAALDKGMTRQQAASLAKNLTVNFNRKGLSGAQAGAVYAFFNAAMQGTARLGETLMTMEPGQPKTLRLTPFGKKVVYGGVLLGSVQALALAAAGFDDDEPPDFVRERSLVIPTGGKSYITIPMPLGLHVIPNVGRVATEFALGGFKNPVQRAAELAGLFADAFNPIGNAGLSMQTLAPTVLDPLVALTENKDWTGKPIARVSSNKDLPGYTQYKDSASAVSKFLAEAINTLTGGNQYVAGVLSPTPDQIDYLAGQLGGGVWREISKVEQTVTNTATGEEVPLHKVPLVGRFVGNAAGQSGEGNAFYSNSNKLNRLETEIKGLEKDGKMAEASALRAENPESRLIAQFNRSERQIQKLRREKRALIDSGADITQVKAMEQRITTIMRNMNKLMATTTAD